MAVRVLSGTCFNFAGKIIEVEVNISKGLPTFNIVGLPDAAVKESKDRVRAAIENSGFEFPLGRITINLAPADVRKIGSLLDLPIAIAILIESFQINNPMEEFLLIGELSLSGEIKGVRGALPIIIEGISEKINNFIFPVENIKECKYIKNSNLYPFSTLKEVVSFIKYRDVCPYNYQREKIQEKNKFHYLDFSEVIGQNASKRAMVVAAAGHHNIILYGSTGSGKSMLSKAFPSIMPDLSIDEQIENAKIYSIAGLASDTDFSKVPFRMPHHTVTKTAIAGGGSRNNILPGEITLANNGVLYLDEMLEFRKEVLEILREPLQDGYINLTRLNSNVKMKCKILLIGSFNMCPCGRREVSVIDTNKCNCSPSDIDRYLKRLSKAIKDRIDIYNYVPPIKYQDIGIKEEYELSSKDMKEIVIRAREIQRHRYKNSRYTYNSELQGKDIFKYCKISQRVENILKYYFEKAVPSLRSYGNVIKLARTIADIKNNKDIKESDVLEAIEYRKDYNGEIV